MHNLTKFLALVFLTSCFGGYEKFKWSRSSRISPTAVLIDHVDPFIGTSGVWWASGHSSPAATAPFGIVKLGPESTILGKRHSHSGYAHNDPEITGFSMNRYTGTGVAEGGILKITPLNRYKNAKALRNKRFVVDKRTEIAHPGYYSVYLHSDKIKVELTASKRAGVHRYSFDVNDPFLSIHLSGAHFGEMETASATVTANGFSGSGKIMSGFSNRYGGLPTHFDFELSSNIKNSFFLVLKNKKWRRINQATYTAKKGEDVYLVLELDHNKNTDLLVRGGLSFTSLAGASAHLAEVNGSSFNAVREDTENEWQSYLEKIEVTGKAKHKKIFYSSIYRSLLMPTQFSDSDFTYLGFDKAVHAGTHNYYSDISLWDTFRTVIPLYNLIYPDVSADIMKSLLLMYQQGGSLPRWPSGGGYSNSMLGVPSVITLSEAFQKGIEPFDSDLALTAATAALSPPFSTRGKKCLKEYIELGYCTYERTKGSVSFTFEYAYGDYSLAKFYKAKGDSDAHKTYLNRSRNALNKIYDPRYRAFLPRGEDGKFTDLGPNGPAWHDSSYLKLGKTGKAYIEGGVLHWRYYSIFDPDYTKKLIGKHFASDLEQNFINAKPSLGGAFPPYNYWHGNEPGFLQAYWFSYLNDISKSQRWLKWVMDHKYGDGPNGLDGDDDAGTLSSWYVLSALGIFPIAGTDRYILGYPRFDEVTVDLGGGESFSIIKTNRNIDKVYLNDQRIYEPYILHSDLVDGAVIRFGDN